MAVGFQREDTVDSLRRERARLLNAIDHLLRSNAVLENELRSQSDSDLRDAVGENAVVIAKYRTKVAELEDEIEALEPGTRASMMGLPDGAAVYI
ncbi:hypothetical protein WJX84_006321 [Apatococcus fuscideae]|uniref:Uncharacterized protein n=1 Tax=Apatococcus fuscideae TaxID=2026836 RepID=A0AAW1RYB3_9CHLO